MRIATMLTTLSSALVFTGCVVSSLNPIYTEDTIALEPGILGSWEEEDGSWSFEEAKGRSYRSTWTADDGSVHFETYLCRIGDHLFMDLYPEKPHPGEDLFMIPTHTFAKISLEGGILSLSFLDQEWLEDRIRSGKISVPHAMVEDRAILTGRTPELQTFLRAHASDEQAFGVTLKLTKSGGD